jgi:mRNA interferase MazF
MKRGKIYLVNFGKKYNSEFGKIRPAVIVQNNIANRNIDKVDFKGITLAPITTNITGGSVRVLIKNRDKLKNDSEICINELCTLDISRIDFDNHLTTLNNSEIDELNIKLKRHLEL